ncbi:hypothetical protein CDV36_000785 [Fusarium kuroshium]|uniref:Uncharacterized protein n=1 Tax=Fusarium kuroshium TaxID=2010991 RepID=A0A3M2SQX1_9HYPO|nr:hypothetical protein CDV36_000785 [Fusarium kuroshium]
MPQLFRPGTSKKFPLPLIKSLNPDSSVYLSSLSRFAANPSCPLCRSKTSPLATHNSTLRHLPLGALLGTISSTSPALTRPTTIDPPGHVTLPSADAGLCDCCCSRVRIP